MELASVWSATNRAFLSSFMRFGNLVIWDSSSSLTFPCISALSLTRLLSCIASLTSSFSISMVVAPGRPSFLPNQPGIYYIYYSSEIIMFPNFYVLYFIPDMMAGSHIMFYSNVLVYFQYTTGILKHISSGIISKKII